MSEQPPDREWEMALRDGLRRLSAPMPSADDFDAGVLAALRRPPPWWRALWQEARPLLAGAACSCVLMLAALWWSQQTPLTPRPISSLSAPLSRTRPLDMAALDHLLDQPNLSAASLLEMTTPNSPAPRPDNPSRPSPPQRRASRLYVPMIV